MTRRATAPQPSTPALSRLPRWVTVLWLVLVLGEVTGAAALLAAGPHRGTGPQRGTAGPGPAQTVVLRVDGVPLRHPSCISLPQAPCGPELAYGIGTRWTSVPAPAGLPFIRKIQVQAGQSVRLNASSDTHTSITCSITVDGRVLSQVTTFTPRSDASAHGNASCHSTIPGSGTDPGAARRTAVLRVDAVPNATCRQALSGCNPGVDYTTSAGDATNFSVAVPFIAEVPEPVGGTVTLNIVGAEKQITCSITVNGRVLSPTSHPRALGSSGIDTATCHARIQ